MADLTAAVKHLERCILLTGNVDLIDDWNVVKATVAGLLPIEPVQWVTRHCENPCCRGRDGGVGQGFPVSVRSDHHGAVECNECFCR